MNKKTIKSFDVFVNENYKPKIKKTVVKTNETNETNETDETNKEIRSANRTIEKSKKRISTDVGTVSKFANAFYKLKKAGSDVASSNQGKGSFTFSDKNGNEVLVKLVGGDKVTLTTNGKTKTINQTGILTALESLTGLKLK